jgi:hypothetical protein
MSKEINMKVEEASKTEGINQTEEKLNDLPVTADQAENAKGGTINYTKIQISYKEQKPDG